ncbi:unnamed protein product [Litomosoides sigmodontis]|uniref:Rabphilin n=1 Tax=Litomosoides sigmodontis TaxID=42156 RepID=A0A3P6TJY2_LITSI|nr:unnamed protein product [Litomosoides sigmodontis]
MLKSGWSVRTGNDRSLTNATKRSGITDSEKKLITAVLSRAEERRMREQQRIGRMIDRLEKMKARATGNGITQCYLCSTDFGLLTSRSYAAMCLQCRRYVCQKNCGVEAYDCVRHENVFLCKICSEYREIWKKSGAWFYKEMPEHVKPVDDPEPHSPLSLYPKSSWQHYTKPEGSNSADKLQQLQNERCSSMAFDRLRKNQSRLRRKPLLSNGYNSEDENADNSTSEEAEALLNESVQLMQRATSNRYVRIQRQHGTGNVPIGYYRLSTVDGRNQITEGSESNHHPTPSTSPRHSPSSYGDNLSQNHSSIQASESTDSGVVPSDRSVRGSAIPTSVDFVNPLVTMIGHADGSHSVAKHSNRSQNLLSSRIPKILPPFEAHGTLDQEIQSQMDGKRCSRPAEQTNKNWRNTFESEEVLLENQLKKVFPLMTSANEPLSSIGSQQSGQDQFPSSHTLSPPSAARTTLAVDLLNQHALNHEHPATTPPSSTSSALKSVMSLESLPTNLEQTKTKQTTNFCDFDSNDRERTVMQPEMKGLSTTRSAVCLQSSAVAELTLRDQAVRHAISGNDIISLQKSGTDMLGSIQFTLQYSSQQMKFRVRLTGAKNLRAMDKNGFSDPYVKSYLIPGASKATKLVSKTVGKTLNPLWNEEFTYYGITHEDKLRKSLRLLVLDRDRIGSDILGEVRVALKNLKNEEETFYDLRLKKAMLESNKSKQVEDVEVSNERGKICVSLLYNVQQGSLYVTIKRCAELLGMDKTGFSDPYVKVSLLPLTSKAHKQKTSTKKRTLNPEFNETLTFVIPFKDLPKKTLQIDVFDKDVGIHDDYIGGILLSTSAKGERQKQWNNCIQNPGHEFEQWHKLEVIE